MLVPISISPRGRNIREPSVSLVETFRKFPNATPLSISEAGISRRVQTGTEMDTVTRTRVESKLKYPDITVGLCVKNSEDTIMECVRSVKNNSYPKDKMKMVVVDGMSSDRTVALCKRELSSSEFNYSLLSDDGKGLGYARELVVKNSIGDYIVWVDGDNILTNSFFKNQVEFLEKNPALGAAMAIILPKNSQVVARTLGYSWLIPTLKSIKKDKTPFLAIQGATISAEIIDEVDGFNTKIKGAGEDLDLFRRIMEEGYKIRANPRAVMYHHMPQSTAELFNRARWLGKGSNQILGFGEVLSNASSQIFQTRYIYDILKDYNDARAAALLLPVNLIQCFGKLIGYLRGPSG